MRISKHGMSLTLRESIIVIVPPELEREEKKNAQELKLEKL